ncbi:MAG TPA: ATP-binding protein [Candidatus Eisenbacteria bacterium]|nr:ATP-binding protein [Candidatus Eisenbacteria bacterium]
MSTRILSLALRQEVDVVLARQRARRIASLLGFEGQDQVRIATAVSEIARNAVAYAEQGMAEFAIEGTTPPQVFTIRITDKGPGIRRLPDILEGRYRSTTGMGIGISGARRLMDQFSIASEPGHGTTVTLKKLVPPGMPLITPAGIAVIADSLATEKPQGAFEEIQRQNQELLATMSELEQRQEELLVLNRELEDTNRGVVALYAELDEKADHLRRADELKSRFLSNMTHEFRTPVNSIQALAWMLLERSDGPLTSEQERQVQFIRRASDELSELVNDLLDLAKVEAGKSEVRPTLFEVSNLFGALRGMLRPLLVTTSVALVFEEPEGIPPLHTDEGKVSQILRNFISNALKFTEQGEVRVRARLVNGGGKIAFEVSDTGIGIAPEDQERVFQEFTQIDSAIQRRVRGTGLGLPLCRKLTELLGGSVSVRSEVGSGSTFIAEIPVSYAERDSPAFESWHAIPGRLPVLVVEDAPEEALLYEKYLSAAGYQVLHARTLREAREALTVVNPALILLDVLLRGEDTWALLTELRRRPDTGETPILIVSTVEDQAKGASLGANAYLLKPIDRQRLIQQVSSMTRSVTMSRVLIVDDEEISRYLIRQSLAAPHVEVLEAATGAEALHVAGSGRIGAICLDLRMPDQDGEEVLRRLKSDPTTCAIPVFVVTSKALGEGERDRLLEMAAGVISKETLSRERILPRVEEAMRRTAAA